MPGRSYDEVVADPEFQGLPPDAQQKVLATIFPERPPGQGEPAAGASPPGFLRAFVDSAKERAGEIGQLPGDALASVKKVGSTLSDRNLPLRMAPMTVPGAGPVLSSAMNLGTEWLAQQQEGATDKGALALSALPAFLAGGARAGRAGNRMATRLSQPRFQAAQQEAMGAADDLATKLTPDTRAMYQAAQQGKATAPPVALPETGRTLAEMQAQHAAAPALSPASDAGREIVTKSAPLGTGGPVALDTVDAYLRELNQAISTRAPGAKTAMGLSGSVVRDMESAAGAGNQGADLLRQAAAAYKQQLGAQKVREMTNKAAPSLTGVGPALNVANLEKFVRADKDLPRLLGPQGMQQVEAFIEKFRGLPPDHAAQFWPMLLATLGGGAALASGGGAKSALGAAVGGAVVPEYLRNLFYVGANPKAVNKGATLAGQAGRAVAPNIFDALQ